MSSRSNQGKGNSDSQRANANSGVGLEEILKAEDYMIMGLSRIEALAFIESVTTQNHLRKRMAASSNQESNA